MNTLPRNDQVEIGAIRRIRVVIKKDLNFPRYSVKAGFERDVNPHNLQELGFPMGGGFCENEHFDVISVTKKTREAGTA